MILIKMKRSEMGCPKIRESVLRKEREQEAIGFMKSILIVGRTLETFTEKEIRCFETAIAAIEAGEIMREERKAILEEKAYRKAEALKATAQLGEIRIMISKGGNGNVAD